MADRQEHQTLRTSKTRLPVRIFISYLLDYVIILALIAGFTALDAAEPFHQHFSLRNYTLQYPFAVKERVSVPLLGVYAVLIPLVIILVYTLVLDASFSHNGQVESRWSLQPKFQERHSLKDRLWQLNCGILGLLLAVGVAVTATSALKIATGKPRPDLIDRCQPKPGSADPPVFGLSNITICTQTNPSVLKDGFRSFPSGHSSTAFAGLFYLSLYLAAKLHVLDKRGQAWKSFIVLAPALGAALIADTRIMDARHHPFDVLFGSSLGIVSAWVAYRQYFPSISDAWSKGRAYPIRTWGSGPANQTEKGSAVLGADGREPLPTFPPTSRFDEENANKSYSSDRVPSRAEHYGSGSSEPGPFLSQPSQRRRATGHHPQPSSSAAEPFNLGVEHLPPPRVDWSSLGGGHTDGSLVEVQPQQTLSQSGPSYPHQPLESDGTSSRPRSVAHEQPPEAPQPAVVHQSHSRTNSDVQSPARPSENFGPGQIADDTHDP